MNPQEVPSHVGVPFAGAEQTVHDAPHAEGLFGTVQLPPHRLYGALQAYEQLVPSQVAYPLDGTKHDLQVAPH